jgi:signal transduction histidine kinase
MISSLQTRLLFAVGVLAVAPLAAVALTARQSTRVEFQRFQDIQRVTEGMDATGIDEALERAASTLEGTCCAAASIDKAAAALSAGQALLVFDDAGALKASAGSGLVAGTVRASFVGGLLKVDFTDRAPGMVAGTTMQFKGGPVRTIRSSDGSPATVHVVPMQRPDHEQPAAQFLGSIDRRLLIGTAAVAVMALLITWGIARRIVGPITELRNATRDVAAGRLSRRVRERGSDEVGELARGFNHMASELERQETLRRNLVHDVAHELRTPLTALRCRVETILDGMVEDPKPALRQVNEEVAHLSQLVSDLEELAHAEARELAFVIADVNVEDVCRSAVRVAGLEGDPRLTLHLHGRAVARADGVRLRQIAVNLLANADRHTPANGTITVSAFSNDTDATITVHNTGSALTLEEQGRVFDRFYRADPSRQRSTGGSGLGLAIVKQLAEAQGGRVTVASDASGVTFTVSLPLAV